MSGSPTPHRPCMERPEVFEEKVATRVRSRRAHHDSGSPQVGARALSAGTGEPLCGAVDAGGRSSSISLWKESQGFLSSRLLQGRELPSQPNSNPYG
jgi:hypothetical protein